MSEENRTMTPHDDQAPTVEYTVKELLGEIRGKIDTLIKIVSEKADKAELVALTGRVATLELSAASKEATRKNEEKIKRFWIWLVFTGVATLLQGGALIFSLVQHGPLK